MTPATAPNGESTISRSQNECLSESISLWERKFHHRNVLDKGGDPLDPVARMHETTNLLAPGNPISTAKDFFLKKRIKRRHCALDNSGCHGFRELFISAGTNCWYKTGGKISENPRHHCNACNGTYGGSVALEHGTRDRYYSHAHSIKNR